MRDSSSGGVGFEAKVRRHAGEERAGKGTKGSQRSRAMVLGGAGHLDRVHARPTLWARLIEASASWALKSQT